MSYFSEKVIVEPLCDQILQVIYLETLSLQKVRIQNLFHINDDQFNVILNIRYRNKAMNFHFESCFNHHVIIL